MRWMRHCTQIDSLCFAVILCIKTNYITIMKKLQKTLPFFLLCCYNICGGVRDDAVLTASEKL